jgi:Xaa-Pro aminopeptidase
MGWGSVVCLGKWSLTSEPGYYEDGGFGIRVENVMEVVEVTTEVGVFVRPDTRTTSAACSTLASSPSRLCPSRLRPVARSHAFSSPPPTHLLPSFSKPRSVQARMIDQSLLEPAERAWLNEYHARCRASVGPLLLKADRGDVYDWLQRETQPL